MSLRRPGIVWGGKEFQCEGEESHCEAQKYLMWSTAVCTYGPPYPSCSIVPSHQSPATWPFLYYLLSRPSQGCASAPPSWWHDRAAWPYINFDRKIRPRPRYGSAVPWHCLPYSGLLLQPSLTFSPHLTSHSCLPTCSSQLTHPSSSHCTSLPPGGPLLPHTWPTPFTSHSDSLHNPFPPAPPHPPPAHSLTLNITRSVELPTRSAHSGSAPQIKHPPPGIFLSNFQEGTFEILDLFLKNCGPFSMPQGSEVQVS